MLGMSMSAGVLKVGNITFRRIVLYDGDSPTQDFVLAKIGSLDWNVIMDLDVIRQLPEICRGGLFPIIMQCRRKPKKKNPTLETYVLFFCTKIRSRMGSGCNKENCELTLKGK